MVGLCLPGRDLVALCIAALAAYSMSYSASS
jgi:hypothetical protein